MTDLPITPKPLNDEERATYEWQMWSPGFGEAAQERLKGASVMVSRCGGLGSVVCYELAAAGVGKLVLAHGGNVKHSDLNRQLLMTHDWLGKPRIDTVVRRLKDLNPRLDMHAVGENVNESNVATLVGEADVIVDAAPLFDERYLMNREAVRQGKPMVECAMYDLEAHATTIVPGSTPCLRCIYPEASKTRTRQFPVFGAVSGTIACIGAMEAIKLITGVGSTLAGSMLTLSLREMTFRKRRLFRDPDCPVCGKAAPSAAST